MDDKTCLSVGVSETLGKVENLKHFAVTAVIKCQLMLPNNLVHFHKMSPFHKKKNIYLVYYYLAWVPGFDFQNIQLWVQVGFAFDLILTKLNEHFALYDHVDGAIH